MFNSVLKKKIQRAVVLSVAEKDSLSAVSYEDVDKNLTERIDFFVSQLGSVEALEKEMGLSLGEIKAQHFEEVREELLINNFKFSLFSDVYITRQEVVDFYNNNPDSIPLSPSIASFSLIEKKRLLLPMPISFARMTAHIFELLPKPLITNDQLRLLKYDNVLSGKYKSNNDFEFDCSSRFEDEVNKYSYMWKNEGEYSKKRVN